jgi:hypothetical protein
MVRQSYYADCELLKLINILSNDNRSPELISSLPDTLSKNYRDGQFTLLDGLLYFSVSLCDAKG